jgi:hypothetical protein
MAILCSGVNSIGQERSHDKFYVKLLCQNYAKKLTTDRDLNQKSLFWCWYLYKSKFRQIISISFADYHHSFYKTNSNAQNDINVIISLQRKYDWKKIQFFHSIVKLNLENKGPYVKPLHFPMPLASPMTPCFEVLPYLQSCNVELSDLLAIQSYYEIHSQLKHL